jgi:hypothetical protein
MSEKFLHTTISHKYSFENIAVVLHLKRVFLRTSYIQSIVTKLSAPKQTTMGGDGGVIASNRKFMRGAGTADKTGDLNRHAAQKFNAQEAMATCALSKTPLHAGANANNGGRVIVADPHGCLYHKEAAVLALLTRKQQQQGTGNTNSISNNTIGPQVRRLADLYEVRFHREEQRIGGDPTCPISGKVLTGTIPAILLVPGIDGMPNVVSERGLSQLSPEELEAEYGCIRKRVRLAPDPVLLENIKEKVEEEHDKDDEERRKAKKDKKKDKKSKRKREGKGDKKNTNSDKKKRSDERSNEKGAMASSNSSSNVRNTKSSSSSVGKAIQSRVDSAIEQNSVLSSLFTNKSALSKITEKEKKDNLFAR